MEPSEISITGARQHNLQNISLRLPRNRLVVITGPSGSGKSSLAFDTIFAEGQRRYIESLSAYARQFLDQMQKPDVDRIEGLSPAIAIEQRSSGSNPRSTIATTTEIFDFLRLLFASIGRAHHPRTGTPLKRVGAQEIVNELLALPESTRLMVLAPTVRAAKGEFRDVFEKLQRDGFVRVRVDGELHDLEKPPKLDKKQPHTIEVVVDRLVLGNDIRGRLTDSIELALRQGEGTARILSQPTGAKDWSEKSFSNRNFDPATGDHFEDLTPRHFSFNSPLGACPRCHGLGTMLVLDEGLVVPDPTRSLDKGAIVPWRRGNRRLVAYYKMLLRAAAKAYEQPFDAPWEKLDPDFRRVLLHGGGDRTVSYSMTRDGKTHQVEKMFEGVLPQLERLHAESESEFTRKRIESFMSRAPCTVCSGARFKPEILAVTVGGPWAGPTYSRPTPDQGAGLNLTEVCALAVATAREWFLRLPDRLTEEERRIARDVLIEINKRLDFLCDVGLGYLTLDRESGTLSGGEAQRIRLATQIGSGLTSVLYILDEPSIGLHQFDNERLLTTLKRLRDLGNTVLVVEHDEDTIRAADHVVDLGPGAGVRGGHIMAQGTPDQVAATERSLTGQYLSRRAWIAVPRHRQPGSGNCLTVRNASENNLRRLNARFPLGTLTCVTGVSGSGKSTLVNDILARALFRHLHGSKERPGTHEGIEGLENVDKAIVIDQSPLGRTPRSNPVTYTGAFNAIRDLFTKLPTARVRGYGPGRFSFNVKGGRCEHCQGDGMITIPMHFLPDVNVTCPVCGGKRFNRETLEIHYRGKNISDILRLTVDEALDFFRPIPQIRERIEPLAWVGLGYLRLGQPANTLSGGEAQRVKLSAELAKKQTGHTVYLLDEPTTGLHFTDVDLLVRVLLKLRDPGNTVIVIEHNLDVIKCADWIMDLGPGGGHHGGQIVAEGTPEQVARCKKSLTGQFLARAIAATPL
jgi:excinuclease ABC subunit A